jgi:hypothetical protein
VLAGAIRSDAPIATEAVARIAQIYVIEKDVRGTSLTRKNALFAGHDDGAENWAIVASLIEACKLNDVEPQAYLADVLVRLVNLWPNNRIDQLLPWTWAAARQQQQRAAA